MLLRRCLPDLCVLIAAYSCPMFSAILLLPTAVWMHGLACILHEGVTLTDLLEKKKGKFGWFSQSTETQGKFCCAFSERVSECVCAWVCVCVCVCVCACALQTVICHVIPSQCMPSQACANTTICFYVIPLMFLKHLSQCRNAVPVKRRHHYYFSHLKPWYKQTQYLMCIN